jgi:hypothetical protein
MSDESQGRSASRGFLVQRSCSESKAWLDAFSGSLVDCMEFCDDFPHPTRVLSAAGTVIGEFRAHEARHRKEEARVELRVSIEQARIMADVCEDDDVRALLDAAMVAFYRPEQDEIAELVDRATDLDTRQIVGRRELDPGKYVAPPERALDALRTYLCAPCLTG